MNLNLIPQIKYTDKGQFYLIAGPCAIEGREMAFQIAQRLKEITTRLELPFIFKGSYRKANRSRLDSFTGIGAVTDNLATSLSALYTFFKPEEQHRSLGSFAILQQIELARSLNKPHSRHFNLDIGVF